jgi:hypothetical protein
MWLAVAPWPSYGFLTGLNEEGRQMTETTYQRTAGDVGHAVRELIPALRDRGRRTEDLRRVPRG